MERAITGTILESGDYCDAHLSTGPARADYWISADA